MVLGAETALQEGGRPGVLGAGETRAQTILELPRRLLDERVLVMRPRLNAGPDPVEQPVLPVLAVSAPRCLNAELRAPVLAPEQPSLQLHPRTIRSYERRAQNGTRGAEVPSSSSDPTGGGAGQMRVYICIPA